MNRIILFLLILSLNCASTEKVKLDENFYADCMETFNDKVKCDSLLKKSEDREVKKHFEREKLTAEQMQGLELRSDFKSKMFGKSRASVVDLIGKPDESYSGGGDTEYYIYRSKPLTRYSVEHDPDKEIVIIFRRNFVSNVNHVQPDSTPKTFVPFGLGGEPVKRVK